MTTLKLTQLIEESKASISNNSGAKAMRPFCSATIATKTMNHLLQLLTGDRKWVNWSGTLGEMILVGTDYTNKDSVASGLHVSKILITNNIIRQYRSDEDGEYYIRPYEKKTVTTKRIRRNGVIKTVDVVNYESEFWNNLFAQVYVRDVALPTKPQFYKPQPRDGFYDVDGGNLVTNVPRSRVAEFSKQAMPLMYQAVEELESIPFYINQEVMRVVQAIKPDLLKFVNVKGDSLIGKKRELNLTIDVAQNIGVEKFWMRWYLGPRGRVYCNNDYLNPQGSKLSKALLYMSNSAPLGLEGFNDLLYHISNCLGNDKVLPNDRIEFVEDHIEFICEVFTNPEDNLWWWGTTKLAMELLAAGIELRDAVASGNELEFVSGLPIGLDHSNSAYQWIAIVMKSIEIAEKCNLTVSDIVSDMYEFISDFAWDRDDLPEYFRKRYKHKRSLAKRTTMTVPYKCSEETAGKHLYKDHRYKEGFKNLSRLDCDHLASILQEVCLKQFPELDQLMKLITKINKELAKQNKQYKLTAPYSKFPFEHSYTEDKKSRTTVTLDGKEHKLTYISEKGYKVKTKGKKSVSTAGPANTSHTIDKEVPVKLICETDYEIFSVHDCYFSIPANVHKMRIDAKRCFYELAKIDWLDEICKQNNYTGKRPKTGQFDPNVIFRNDFCIS